MKLKKTIKIIVQNLFKMLSKFKNYNKKDLKIMLTNLRTVTVEIRGDEIIA